MPGVEAPQCYNAVGNSEKQFGFVARLLPPPPPGAPPERLARVAAANSAAIRKHFAELTGALLAPLDVCTRPVAPPQGGAPLPHAPPPHLPPFSHTDFLEGLQKAELPPALLQRFGNRVSARTTSHSLVTRNIGKASN